MLTDQHEGNQERQTCRVVSSTEGAYTCFPPRRLGVDVVACDLALSVGPGHT